MITEILIGVGLVVALLWAYNFHARRKGFPPGPFIFPVFGSLPVIGYETRSLSFVEVIRKWRREHGDIVGLRFGNYNAVVIHDYEKIKEAFNEAEFAGRPLLAPIRLLAGDHQRGITASEGEHQISQRRFALRHLRDFGFGKKSMEALAQDDIVELINSFKAQTGLPIETSRRFSTAVLSSLWNIIAGEKFAHDDPKFEGVLTTLNGALSSTAGGGAPFFFPWLLKLAPEMTGWTKFGEAVDKVKALIQGYIDEHKARFQDDYCADFMDVYIKEILTTTDPHSAFFGKVGEENMLVGILNLFAAGAETTSSTLNWALYFLSGNKAVQKKFQQEIDEVVGNSRLPSLEDRERMPFTMALMQEVLRKSTLTPFGVVHRTIKDVSFHGHMIPGDTVIMANLYEVHHDPTIWGDPETFRPERFLTADGKGLLKDPPKIIPFSIGKRACLGEILARNNFFLFLTSIFQRFEITPDPNSDRSGSVVTLGLFRFPPPFKVIFQDRQK